MIHPLVRGTGHVGLCAILAWLTAFFLPFTCLWMLARGLWLGPLETAAGGVLEAAEASGSLWGSVRDVFEAVRFGVLSSVFGFFLLAVSLLLLIVLCASARANYRTGRVLIFVNLCLCAVSGLIFRSMISRAADFLADKLHPSYANAPTVALCMIGASVTLWIIGFAVYQAVIGKSNRMSRQGG
jgi:hypothetical protein